MSILIHEYDVVRVVYTIIGSTLLIPTRCISSMSSI